MIISIDWAEGHAVFRPRGRLGRDRFDVYRSAIEGAKYDRDRGVNYAAVDKVPTILQRLRESNFDAELTPSMAARLKEHTAQMWLDLQSARERLVKIDEDLAKRGIRLYPFQRSGVQWLAMKMGALLADEMGLGKTIQAICALPAGAPVLIVCPDVAKGVWKREISKARPHLRPVVLKGRGSFRWPKEGEVVIINYDILPDVHKTKTQKVKGKEKQVPACEKFCTGCLPFLQDVTPGTVVLADEAHALKNSKAQRTVKFRALSEAARSVGGRSWLLTATPLLNRPQELWSVYQAAGIAQEAFGSWNGFLEVFNGRPGAWGGMDWGTPLAEAGERIKRVTLRRLRKEVLPDLPTKTWRELTVEVDSKTLKKCDALVERFGGVEKMAKLIESGKLDFEELSAVRHALAVAKIPAVMNLVEDFEEQEEPVVVFSAHRALVEELKKRPGWRAILGGISAEERTEIEDAFQRGELKGVAATIQAGGVAITLTRASHAVFSDLEWTPALNAQAEDRICRIGQTRGCVITVLQAEHPLDERINELLLQKQKLISGSVDAARETGEVKASDTMLDTDYEALVKAAEEEIRKAEEPKVDKPVPSRFRKPKTNREEWVIQAITTLARLDPDMAGVHNDVGFNGTDTGFGHSLADTIKAHGGLSEAQYRSALKMCQKYHRQVGAMPVNVYCIEHEDCRETPELGMACLERTGT